MRSTINDQSVGLAIRNARKHSTKDRPQFLWDTKLKGFGVKIYSNGRASYLVQTRTVSGRLRRVTLGTHDALTANVARHLARKTIAEFQTGNDPATRRRQARSAKTFGQFADAYLLSLQERRKHPGEDRRYLRQDCRGIWHTPLAEITTSDLERIRQTTRQRGAPTANRWLASVRAALQQAVREELIPINPAAALTKCRENPPRDRRFSDDELAAIEAAVAAEPDPYVRAAFRVLIDCGLRKSECLAMRWEDLEGIRTDVPTLHLRSPKAGRPQSVPLPLSTAAVLRGVPRRLASPWVFPGSTSTGHIADLRSAWNRIRAAAGIENARIHDLRRTFGWRVAKDFGIHVAQRALRHSSPNVTSAVYAQLRADDVREAFDAYAGNRAPIDDERESPPAVS